MSDEKDRAKNLAGEATWGPKLFAGALVAALVFFWWLVIYSHGVTPHH